MLAGSSTILTTCQQQPPIRLECNALSRSSSAQAIQYSIDALICCTLSSTMALRRSWRQNAIGRCTRVLAPPANIIGGLDSDVPKR